MFSDVAVGMLTDALADMLLGVLTGIGVDMLLDVNVNAFTGVMAVEFAIPAPLRGSIC